MTSATTTGTSVSTGTIKGYHAHVYFDADQRDEAMALREAVSELIPEAELGRVHDGPIAFHTAPMYQIAITPEHFAELIPWLMLERGSLRILVHPLTGDPWLEHTDQALWLGEPVPIDLEKLRRVAA